MIDHRALEYCIFPPGVIYCDADLLQFWKGTVKTFVILPFFTLLCYVVLSTQGQTVVRLRFGDKLSFLQLSSVFQNYNVAVKEEVKRRNQINIALLRPASGSPAPSNTSTTKNSN